MKTQEVTTDSDIDWKYVQTNSDTPSQFRDEVSDAIRKFDEMARILSDLPDLPEDLSRTINSIADEAFYFLCLLHSDAPNTIGSKLLAIATNRWKLRRYRNQIIRAAKKAVVPHWTPYQMRHTNLTHIRQALGIEYSQALGGHSTRQMAEHYARIAETKAIEAALAAPSIA